MFKIILVKTRGPPSFEGESPLTLTSPRFPVTEALMQGKVFVYTVSLTPDSFHVEPRAPKIKCAPL